VPSLTVSLAAEGPLIPLVLMVSTPRRNALISAGLPVPKPVVIQVLVDTGASCSCIESSQLAKLGISPTGVIAVHTPSTGSAPVQLKQFDVDLGIVLDDGKFQFIETLPVIESQFPSQNIDGLLGRDVLSRGILIYNGTAKTFTLSF
jgi:hypothetical protein